MSSWTHYDSNLRMAGSIKNIFENSRLFSCSKKAIVIEYIALVF